MKVALIKPSVNGTRPNIEKVVHLIGGTLPVLAAYTPENVDLDAYDESFGPIDFNQRYDLVGITVMTPAAQKQFDSIWVDIAATYIEVSSYAALGAIFYAGHKALRNLNDPHYLNLRERTFPVELPINYQFRAMIASKLERDTTLQIESETNNKDLENNVQYLRALQED